MYLGYLIFTLFMTIGAAETNKVLFAIFVMIDFLFIGLALSSFGIMEHGMHLLAANSELIIALLSLYGAGANVLNKHFGFNFLPIGKPFGIFTRDAFLKKEKTVKHNLKKGMKSFDFPCLFFVRVTGNPSPINFGKIPAVHH